MSQIPRGPGQHVAPVFAGARFYLDDPQPTPQIVFAASTPDTGAFALYGTDLQGTVLHRLTFGPQSDFSPAVLPTGEVVFTAWQRVEHGQAGDSAMALLSVNIDGTDLMPVTGNHEPPRYKDMPAVAVAEDRVYFVESDRRAWPGGGKLAYVAWGPAFHSPATLPDAAGEPGGVHNPRPPPATAPELSELSSTSASAVVARPKTQRAPRRGRSFRPSMPGAIVAAARG